jgi:hypothetical protein
MTCFILPMRFVLPVSYKAIANTTQMPRIMSYFFYEFSCRRLLALLTDRINEAREHRHDHVRRDAPESENESRKIESLLKAAEAVDAECKKLAYWSDMRELAKDGENLTAIDAGHAKYEQEDQDWSHLSGGHDKIPELEEEESSEQKFPFEEEVESETSHETQGEESTESGNAANVPGGWVDRTHETEAEEVENETPDTERNSDALLGQDEEELEPELKEIDPVPEASQPGPSD